MEHFDLRQLRYFLIVAKTLNISAAARELRMTQPALSRQIRVFEDALGSPLFERHHKSISLTRAGEAMRQEGAVIMRSVQNGLKRFRRTIEGTELRIGYAPSLAAGLIEKTIACFSARFPGIRVSWFDASTQEMWDGLKNEELDLILEVETNDPLIHWHPIGKKPLRIAIPTDHPFARKRFLKSADLDGERLLLLSRHDYPGYWHQVSTYFSEHHIDAQVMGEFDGIASLRMGIEAGLGIAFVAGSPTGLTTRKLKPDPSPLSIAIGSLKGRNLAEWEQVFIDEMVQLGATQ